VQYAVIVYYVSTVQITHNTKGKRYMTHSEPNLNTRQGTGGTLILSFYLNKILQWTQAKILIQ